MVNKVLGDAGIALILGKNNFLVGILMRIK